MVMMTTIQYKMLGNAKQKIFDAAKTLARTSKVNMKHGAILISNGKIISTSVNKNEFCRFAGRFRRRDKGIPTLHAEIGAILGIARNRTQGAHLYVVKVNRNDDFLNSKPCSMCLSVLAHVGIKKIFFSISDDKIGVLKI